MGFREHLEGVVSSVSGSVACSLMGFDGIAVDTQPLHGWMVRPYSDVIRLRSRTSTSIPACSSVSRAIPTSRKDFDISFGQVPSLRAEPQINKAREGVVGSDQIIFACSRRCLVATHSQDRS